MIRGLTWHGIVDREAAISAGTLLDWIGCAVFIEGPGRSACGYFPRETEAETETETDRRSQSVACGPPPYHMHSHVPNYVHLYVCMYIYIYCHFEVKRMMVHCSLRWDCYESSL